MRFIWVGLILTTFFSTCQNRNSADKGEVIVSVYGKKMYKTDLDNISFEGISYNDSVVRARAFIDKWIRNQLLLQQAENNLSPEQLDFTKKLEDYRNSLVINKYETELIAQNLNTEVSENEISKYYEKNSSSFILNRNIVKYLAVSIPNDINKKWIFTKLLRDYDSILVDSVVSLSDNLGLAYSLQLDNWQNFDELIEAYDLNIEDQVNYLNDNKFISINDESVTTLIRICDYRKIGDISPCEIEIDRIKYIILSARKKKLLDNLYDDLYSKALRERAFDTY